MGQRDVFVTEKIVRTANVREEEKSLHCVQLLIRPFFKSMKKEHTKLPIGPWSRPTTSITLPPAANRFAASAATRPAAPTASYQKQLQKPLGPQPQQYPQQLPEPQPVNQQPQQQPALPPLNINTQLVDALTVIMGKARNL